MSYEQRHRANGVWSDWYRSSEKAYREHVRGPVGFYEVRPLPAPPPSCQDEECLNAATPPATSAT